jgi:lipoyl(octanoyl) transferase
MQRVGCRVYNLVGQGLTSYQEAWRMQKALSERSSELYKRNQTVVDSLLLVQHSSTYSLGRGATPDNLKFKADADCPHDLFRVERGGEVTWHGPGQLVAYPIFNLNNHRKDLHW